MERKCGATAADRGMLVVMSDLFAGYAEALQRSDAWDEMFAPEFTLRTDYRPVERVLEELSLDDVTAIAGYLRTVTGLPAQRLALRAGYD